MAKRRHTPNPQSEADQPKPTNSPPSPSVRQSAEALRAEVERLSAANQALQDRVQELELRTTSLLNNRLIVAWMKDDQGRYDFINSEYERRFGVRDEQCRGKTDDEIWPPELAATFKEHDQQVLQTNEPLEVIEDALYVDGTRGHFLALKFPIIDAAGRRFVGGLAVDITARINAERALADSQERLRLTARMASFGTYYGEVESGQVTWSPELQRILGLEASLL